MENLSERIENIIKSIVDNPDEVSVTTVGDGNTQLFTINVKKEDIGYVIGKEGKIIQALRKIIESLTWRRLNRRSIVEISDPKPISDLKRVRNRASA